jgi:hypothetical protein
MANYYGGTGYNPNVDYSEQMKKYLEQGGANSLGDLEYKSMYDARTNKIADMTPEYAQKQGVASDYTQVTGYQYPNKISYEVPKTQTDPNAAFYKTIMDMLQNNQTSSQSLLDQQRLAAQQALEAARSGGLTAIRQAYDQARAGYIGQNDVVNQQADSALRANDVNYYAQALPQLRAAMEAAGNYGGGEMVGQNVNLLASKGQNANDINVSRANQLQAIANAVQQLNAEQPIKEAEINASMDAQAANNSLQAIQNALAQQNTNFSQTMDAYKLGLDQQNIKWQQKFQQDQADWERSTSNPSVLAQILANEAATINLQYLPEQMKLELQKIQQDIANGRLTTQAQLDETRARIKQIADNSAQGWAQINNQKTQINNQQAQDAQQNSTAAYNNAVNQIDNSVYVTKDPYTNALTVSNPTGLRSYIISLSLPDAQTRQLLLRYGLNPNPQ